MVKIHSIYKCGPLNMRHNTKFYEKNENFKRILSTLTSFNLILLEHDFYFQYMKHHAKKWYLFYFRIVVPSSNAITKAAHLAVQYKITFGVSVLVGETKVNGVTYPLWTVPPGSITNAPTEGNASMTTQGSCISVRVNKAGWEEGVKPPHQTCVPSLLWMHVYR